MPTLLECSICKVLRNAETEFHYNGQYYANGVRKKRKDCVYCARKRRSEYFKDLQKREKINTRRRKNYREDKGARKEKNKRNSLKQLYGLTLEQFNSMRKDQNFCCAICKKPEQECSKKTLYVDHSHVTKKVRGLLCSRCNSILGFFDEDIAKIEQAIKYLKKVRSKE